MPERKIKGELRERELAAIARVAGLVPSDGVIVEVGSYMGLSAHTWSKHADASVSIYCFDPWNGYRGSSLETFRQNVADCPNITPMQGRSPKDFLDWDRPIDLYFEDAVHSNPVLRQNIDFWTGFLKPGGIVCGHDYRSKCPDVRNEAHALAKRMNYRFFRVETFWCLLPERAFAMVEAGAALARLGAQNLPFFKYDLQPERREYNNDRGQNVVVRGTLRNNTDDVWPIDTGSVKVLAGARVFDADGQKVKSARAPLGVNNLGSGESLEFEIPIPVAALSEGRYRIELDLVIDHTYWFANKGAESVSIVLNVEDPSKT